ncbi:hypothetical protein NDU88_003257 [Pleurodeles waltl]|uniref:Uncharacterized protein n=1 Tax=Pleurodeles waltl TaxID=8319 RepID=A0AAV7WUU2_PLEWA|nr:hypothetical protein NDU88_003257 [Pleurodeles waltl]
MWQPRHVGVVEARALRSATTRIDSGVSGQGHTNTHTRQGLPWQHPYQQLFFGSGRAPVTSRARHYNINLAPFLDAETASQVFEEVRQNRQRSELFTA